MFVWLVVFGFCVIACLLFVLGGCLVVCDVLHWFVGFGFLFAGSWCLAWYLGLLCCFGLFCLWTALVALVCDMFWVCF